MTRHLLISKRVVPLERTAEYAALWRELSELVTAAGARAWTFQAQRAAHRFVDFIEWQSEEPSPITQQSDIARALQELHSAFPPEESETWIETKI